MGFITMCCNTFTLFNVMIKGVAASIKTALDEIDSDSYEFYPFTYDPEIDSSDTTVVKAGIVFKKWNEGYISKNDIPFSFMPDIKLIGLGNGGDGYVSNGLYVFFKDFGETSVSECYQFTPVSPHKVGIKAQDDVLDRVLHSFMDHPWEFEFKDRSCGKPIKYGFNKWDIEVVKRWNADETDDKYTENITSLSLFDDELASYESSINYPRGFPYITEFEHVKKLLLNFSDDEIMEYRREYDYVFDDLYSNLQFKAHEDLGCFISLLSSDSVEINNNASFVRDSIAAMFCEYFLGKGGLAIMKRNGFDGYYDGSIDMFKSFSDTYLEQYLLCCPVY